MILLKAIIHELIKEPAKKGIPEIRANVAFAPELLDVKDQAAITLVESIQSLYGTKGNASSQGTFEFDESYNFPGQFSKFINSEIDDSTFLALTKHSMNNLRNTASSKNFATGGYIVFAYYTQDQKSFVLTAMVKKKNGIKLDHLFKPESIQEVDLSKLHQAIKVNVASYLSAVECKKNDIPYSGSYLSFISPKSNTSSGYFISAFGCTDALPAEVSTRNALEAVVQFFEENESISKLKNEAHDLVIKHFEETLTRTEKTCSIDDLNQVVNSLIPISDENNLIDSFVEYANNEPFNIPDVFYTHSTVVRLAKKIKLQGHDGAWVLNFDKRMLGTTDNADIQYCKKGKGTIIIRNLSNKIKEELVSAISKRN
ncbi:MAG: nucleoid-associated protein [Colwellia sp.]